MASRSVLVLGCGRGRDCGRVFLLPHRPPGFGPESTTSRRAAPSEHRRRLRFRSRSRSRSGRLPAAFCVALPGAAAARTRHPSVPAPSSSCAHKRPREVSKKTRKKGMAAERWTTRFGQWRSRGRQQQPLSPYRQKGPGFYCGVALPYERVSSDWLQTAAKVSLRNSQTAKQLQCQDGPFS